MSLNTFFKLWLWICLVVGKALFLVYLIAGGTMLITAAAGSLLYYHDLPLWTGLLGLFLTGNGWWLWWITCQAPVTSSSSTASSTPASSAATACAGSPGCQPRTPIAFSHRLADQLLDEPPVVQRQTTRPHATLLP